MIGIKDTLWGFMVAKMGLEYKNLRGGLCSIFLSFIVQSVAHPVCPAFIGFEKWHAFGAIPFNEWKSEHPRAEYLDGSFSNEVQN